MQLPLQGNIVSEPYWGPRTGEGCAGCHQVSPDGKYVAIVEVGQMRFIDTDTDLELFLDYSFVDPTSMSWRPDVATDPPYQFVYSNGADLEIASLFDGPLGTLAGADDPTMIDTMPTWGPNGQIAFVRGNAPAQTSDGGAFGIEGPCDVYIVDEDGGTEVLVPGASANSQANYYPQFSPNGIFLAITQSASATSTIAATDARLRLVRADLSGTVLALDGVNGSDGASSYPTWSVDGSFLSFSSNRSGGAGDWDIWIVGVEPTTGATATPMNLNDFEVGEINTADFEHAAQWSP
jgi:Tol biopolymer transport system component